MNKKEILASPWRENHDTSKEYDTILIIPSGTKHDSGYMDITIVGCTIDVENNTESYEICGTQADDIECHFPMLEFGSGNVIPYVRMDCLYPQGIFRYHGRRGKFTVSDPLSTMEIHFHKDH